MFINNSKCDRTAIKRRIIKDNLIPYKCQSCGCDDQWLGKTMPLILDHIDGINNNNEFKNLRFVCSNCDSIQDTYKSSNNSLSVEQKKKRKEILDLSKKLNKEKKLKIKINHWGSLIKDNDIDFTKKTWGKQVGKLLNVTPQYALKFVNSYINIP